MKKNYFILCILWCCISPVIAQESAEPIPFTSRKTYSDFRVAIGGGYAHRLGKQPDESDPNIREMNRKLNHGAHVDMEFQYFFHEVWGVGITSNFVTTSAGAGELEIPAYGSTFYVSEYEERHNFFFIGPSGVIRGDLSKFLITTGMAIGPIFYSHSNNVISRATKTAFGVNVGVAAEYKLSKMMGVGVKLSYTAGTIQSLNWENTRIELDEKYSVSNFMFTAFLSFRSW